MKLLASAVALIMVGLTGMWLWFDATADARQDLPGVVVSVDDAPADLGVAQPGDAGAGTQDRAPADGADQTADGAGQTASVSAAGDRDQADRDAVTSRMVTVDTLLTTLRAARGDLVALSDDIVAQRESDEAARAAGSGGGSDSGVSGWTGSSGSSDSSGSGSSGSSGSSGGGTVSPPPPPPPAPAPQPVNPAPVTPPGMCWDDGELEECDDDEWDDDGSDD